MYLGLQFRLVPRIRPNAGKSHQGLGDFRLGGGRNDPVTLGKEGGFFSQFFCTGGKSRLMGRAHRRKNAHIRTQPRRQTRHVPRFAHAYFGQQAFGFGIRPKHRQRNPQLRIKTAGRPRHFPIPHQVVEVFLHGRLSVAPRNAHHRAFEAIAVRRGEAVQRGPGRRHPQHPGPGFGRGRFELGALRGLFFDHQGDGTLLQRLGREGMAVATLGFQGKKGGGTQPHRLAAVRRDGFQGGRLARDPHLRPQDVGQVLNPFCRKHEKGIRFEVG